MKGFDIWERRALASATKPEEHDISDLAEELEANERLVQRGLLVHHEDDEYDYFHLTALGRVMAAALGDIP